MISIIALGVAAIVFLLGVIVLQLGRTTFASIAVFIVALLLSAMIGLSALASVGTL